jgi:hypothetical protein
MQTTLPIMSQTPGRVNKDQLYHMLEDNARFVRIDVIVIHITWILALIEIIYSYLIR